MTSASPKMEKNVRTCFIPDCKLDSSHKALYPFLIDTEDINSWIVGVGSPGLVGNVPTDHRRICEQYFLCTDHMNFLDSIKYVEKLQKQDEEQERVENNKEDPEGVEESVPDQLSQQLSSLTVSQPRDDEFDDPNIPKTEECENYVELTICPQDLSSIFDLIPEDSTSLCRVCGKSTANPISIFPGEDESGEVSILEKIRYYLPIKIENNDDLPKIICGECDQRLRETHDLAMTSLATEALLTGAAPKDDLIEYNYVSKENSKPPGHSDQVTSTAADCENENCSQESVSDAAHLNCWQPLITSDEEEGSSITFEELKLRGSHGKKRPLSQDTGAPAVKKKKKEPIFEKWYKCNTCAASSTDEDIIKFHKNRHRLRKPVLYWCNFCATEFPKESIFANHVLSIHKRESQVLSQAYKCSTCHRVFSLKSTALLHYVIKCAIHPVQNYDANKSAEDVYIRYAYTCEFCWKGFAYVSSLNAHRSEQHSNSNCWTGKFEISEQEKRERILDIFGIRNAFACKFCAKIFLSLENYLDHENQHRDRLFKCSSCNETFTKYEDFKEHRETQHDYRIVFREVIEEQLQED
ncbi:GDNF-inducible zinc finger protein 1 [Fopius arisanus]|uniref:GDNF-inducible zinc finger protein 1 n=1 Tax=Fopius arisanus TaxID=64838 RepID=A0A0C9RSC6_9HYME|nr:PREDICTED: GDNF-inducible zinc finger protein 1-like [Fopius arisanus]XP_011309769.1 PREDICTED: GDNF-inducible zinc finger protein 1-like [Fopius arisanus]XP_011309770.1 PREDICTED: GDNF-inducible zinc finger protein 1-like [Fopius arisanus]XP_011309771.1 PREDICTED: GDNF-inducible zinc finger protein 1-like [Fopius arisanus]XP_011309772.1 PREDICTED: GDNF-inducible zinc finger protein 1-like [Fopius arisanus]XP_011309773.1 PREDICTED: GDNF-inducible zinc finger protein 1-like [Fopius arisanus]